MDVLVGEGVTVDVTVADGVVKIVGVDLSRKLIKMARANAEKAGFLHQLSFKVGNSARLNFNKASFDMVISTGMLHSLKNPVAVLKEIHRVLKEGGQAWIYDPANVTGHIDIRKWKASLNLRERIFLWLFKSIGLHEPIATYRRNQVIPMIEAAGFAAYDIDEQDNEIRIKLKK